MTFLIASNKGADQTSRMCRLVCACAIRKPPEDRFSHLEANLHSKCLIKSLHEEPVECNCTTQRVKVDMSGSWIHTHFYWLPISYRICFWKWNAKLQSGHSSEHKKNFILPEGQRKLNSSSLDSRTQRIYGERVGRQFSKRSSTRNDR